MHLGHFRDWSIGRKFLITFLLILMLPLIMLFFYINISVARLLEEQSYLTVVETIKQAETPISYMLNDTNFLSKEILRSEYTQEYLRQNAKEQPSELFTYRYAVDLYLAQLLDSREHISRVAFFFDGKMISQSGNYMPHDSLSPDLNVSELENRGLYWLPAKLNESYISQHARGYELVAVRAINDMEHFGVTLGIQKLSIPEHYICSLYEPVAGEKSVNIFLTNEKGDVLSSLDKSYLGQNIEGTTYDPRFKGESEGYYFNELDELVSYYNISSTDWYLVRVDKRVDLQGGQVANTIILVSLALASLFGLSFWLLQRKYIIRPVKALSAEVLTFKGGNFKSKRQAYTKDEIGSLHETFSDMAQNINNLIQTVYKSKIAAKEAQLMYLQSQINPHFLYNTLDSIRWMAIKSQQQEIATQVEALAHLFKHALNDGRDITTVEQEVRHLQSYITIQTARFGTHIEVNLNIDEKVMGCTVLNLVLQPLVENAYVHGLEQKMDHGVIDVHVFENENTICYRVKDNGLGADESTIQSALNEGDGKNALALNNINKRLRYKYGEEYGIVFESKLNEGTCVTVNMPFETEVENIEDTDCR